MSEEIERDSTKDKPGMPILEMSKLFFLSGFSFTKHSLFLGQ